jgi:hypothetical protein
MTDIEFVNVEGLSAEEAQKVVDRSRCNIELGRSLCREQLAQLDVLEQKTNQQEIKLRLRELDKPEPVLAELAQPAAIGRLLTDAQWQEIVTVCRDMKKIYSAGPSESLGNRWVRRLQVVIDVVNAYHEPASPQA